MWTDQRAGPFLSCDGNYLYRPAFVFLSLAISSLDLLHSQGSVCKCFEDVSLVFAAA